MWYFTPVITVLEKVETEGQDQLHSESDANLGYVGYCVQRGVDWRHSSVVKTMYYFSRGLELQGILTQFPVSTRSIPSPLIE